MKEPELEGRHHNTDGQISQKHGNTKIETLCKTYGGDVAGGIRSDAMLNTVLEKNGVPSLTSLTKKVRKRNMTASVGDEFKPGDKVQASGIYRVTHDKNHTAAHDVTCVHGKIFPPCNGCGKHPRFVLVRAAKHIENHENFK